MPNFSRGSASSTSQTSGHHATDEEQSFARSGQANCGSSVPTENHESDSAASTKSPAPTRVGSNRMASWSDLWRSLSEAFAAARPTFHVFRHSGQRLCYELNRGTLLELDEYSEDLLKRIETHGSQALDPLTPGGNTATNITELRRGYERAARELLTLHQLGFFHLEPLETRGEREEQLELLLNTHPNKLMLMVQTNCNLACTYCYEVASGFHSKGKSMSVDTAKQSIDSLVQRSGARRQLEITFFGGEPLINLPVIKEIVGYCKANERHWSKTFSFSLTTNATLLSDETIDYLVESRFAVMISLDGPPEKNDIHRKTLGGKGTGRDAINNAHRLISKQKLAGVRVATIRATMTNENGDHDALAGWFSDQGFERVMIGASQGRAYQKDPWDIKPKGRAEADELFGEKAAKYLLSVRERTPPPVDARLGEGLARIDQALTNPKRQAIVHCGVGRNMTAHTQDGSLYPCHRYAGEDSFKIGTIESGVDEVRLREYYRGILDVYDQHCSRCWARYICGGQCAWYISKPDGTVGYPDKEGCDALRDSFERQLWLYQKVKGKVGDLDPSTSSNESDREGK